MDLFRFREKHTPQSVGHHTVQMQLWNVVWLVFISRVISYTNEWEDYSSYFGAPHFATFIHWWILGLHLPFRCFSPPLKKNGVNLVKEENQIHFLIFSQTTWNCHFYSLKLPSIIKFLWFSLLGCPNYWPQWAPPTSYNCLGAILVRPFSQPSAEWWSSGRE